MSQRDRDKVDRHLEKNYGLNLYLFVNRYEDIPEVRRAFNRLSEDDRYLILIRFHHDADPKLKKQYHEASLEALARYEREFADPTESEALTLEDLIPGISEARLYEYFNGGPVAPGLAETLSELPEGDRKVLTFWYADSTPHRVKRNVEAMVPEALGRFSALVPM